MRPMQVCAAGMCGARSGATSSAMRLRREQAGEWTYASPKSLSLIWPSGSNKKF